MGNKNTLIYLRVEREVYPMVNNEDKIFNLLEKVYVDLQDTKNEVSKIGMVIENEIRPNLKVLFETQTQILTKLEEHDKRFDSIDKKLERHDVEIRVIKGGMQ